MEYVECPECMGVARRMPVLSSVNRTENFFQCDSCQQVSLMPKDESRPPISFRFVLQYQGQAART